MYVERIGEDKFRVVNNGETMTLTLDEVMYLLSKPVAEMPTFIQETMEDFWNSKAIYPKED